MNKKKRSNPIKDNSESNSINHENRPLWREPIVVAAIITALSVIIVALINAYAPDFIPRLLHRPTVSISNDVRDINGNPVAVNSAPFQVSIKGTVSNADGKYVYLIVADKYHHYVQPGLGPNVDNDFSNLCQLGQMSNPDSYGQQYTIYAVVTDNPYTAYAFFEGNSYIAKSKELKITREQLPTTTP